MTDPNSADHNVSRRRFLLTSGALGAGAVAAGMSAWPVIGDPGKPGFTPPSDCGSPSDTEPLWKDDVKGVTPQNKGPNILVDQPDKNKNAYALHEGNKSGEKYQYNLLVIPVARISGIECPGVWGDKYLNLWPYAWRQATNRFGGVDVMLGINSFSGRSHDQLHIHLTALQRPARKALDGMKVPTDLGAWNKNLQLLHGASNDSVFRIVQVNSLDTNPFTLMKDHISQNDMFAQCLAVVRGTSGGYYLLNSQGSPISPNQPPHDPVPRINNTWGTAAIDDLMYRG